DGRASPVGERSNRAGRVAPDALQGAERLILARKATAVACDRFSRDPVEVHRADVVAKRIPGALDVGDVRGGQRLQGRVAAAELVVIRDDPVHVGLLEHDLRDEQAIRVARLPPGEISLMAPVPAEEALPKSPSCSRVWDPASRASTSRRSWHGAIISADE